MASIFNVHDAAGYEQLMGRWSKKLAPQFIALSRLGKGVKGSRCRVWNRKPDLLACQIQCTQGNRGGHVSPIFVNNAIQLNTDARVHIQQADACALPFEDSSFDAAPASLMLHLVPDTRKAVAEMRRVVQPGGVVAAVVWDHLGKYMTSLSSEDTR